MGNMLQVFLGEGSICSLTLCYAQMSPMGLLGSVPAIEGRLGYGLGMGESGYGINFYQPVLSFPSTFARVWVESWFPLPHCLPSLQKQIQFLSTVLKPVKAGHAKLSHSRNFFSGVLRNLIKGSRILQWKRLACYGMEHSWWILLSEVLMPVQAWKYS